MRGWRAETMTDLHEKVCRKLVHSDAEGLDIISSVDVQIFNVVAEAMTMEWAFDLRTMWLTPARWSMMCRQYIDPEALEIFIEQITAKMGKSGRGVAALRTNLVKSRGGVTNKETRRWGSCMLAITYCSVPAPQITLFSRTSYLGYLGAMDMSVAWMVGRYVAQALGLAMDEMRFVWMIQAVQFHNFKSLAYLFNSQDPELRPLYRACLLKHDNELSKSERKAIQTWPALRLCRSWMQRVVAEDEAGKSYGDMNYNTYRRIRRRYHTEVHGIEYAKQFEGWSKHKTGPQAGENKEFFKAYHPLPNTPIATLDFGKLGLPLGAARDLAVPFQGSDDEDEDDD